MKIRGNTIGTPIKPGKTLVKAQNLTKAEKQQARHNIGALGHDDYMTQLAIVGQDQDCETVIYSGGSTGDRKAILCFDGSQYAGAPVLRGIADGVEYQDAATFGQLDRQRESLADYVGDFATDNVVWYSEAQNLTPQQKAQARENIFAASVAELDEVIDYIADNCVQYTQAGSELTESQKADARQNIDAASNLDILAVEQLIDALDSKVGDIETALDAIIALQNDIINGFVVPTALNDEGGDGV